MTKKTTEKKVSKTTKKKKKKTTKKPNKTEQRLAKKKIEARKKKFLKAYEVSFTISSACKKSKVSRTQFYEYYKTDAVFAEDVDDCEEIMLDFVESQAFQLVKLLDGRMIRHILKTKGRKRGYGTEIDININKKGTKIIEPKDETDIDEIINNGGDLSKI